MSAVHLGTYNTASSRTHVGFQFSTHAAAGGNVAPNSAFEAADLRIYKAADGAAFSATQRSSANGITMTSPFDSLTGFHDVDIDLTDNTDAGFYAAGCRYSVVLAPDETVDGQTLTAVPLAYFEIGRPQVDVREFGGSAGTFSSGRPEVNTTHVAGTSQTAGDIIGDTNDIQAKIGTPSNLGGGATLAANLSDIEAQTDDIGVAGQGLTALPWNAAWDPEVQSEVADALAVYDPPTRAEATADVNSVLAELGNATYGLAALETLVDDIEGFVDALETRIPANVPEIETPPGATPTPAQLWAALYQIAMNQYTQTATEAKFRKADGTVAGTAAVSDDGTTATRGAFA
jgi:hypothetical protein